MDYLKNYKYYFVYGFINIWNLIIKPLRNYQNRTNSWNFEKAPGFQFALNSKHKSIQKLHAKIFENHNQILSEVLKILQDGYRGIPMNQMDPIQGKTFKNEDGWRPIWLKFLDVYSGISDKLPTLTNIVREMENEIILLHVSMMLPGTDLTPHYGISMAHLRYHYGLLIPDGDTGLRIEKSVYKWKTGEGIQFDDTYLHSAWNKTTGIRLVIFADIPRNMNPIFTMINKFILKLIQYSSHIKEIQARMKREGIIID